MIRSMMGRKKGGMAIEGAPNGVYILRTDNRLYTEKMWKRSGIVMLWELHLSAMPADL